MVVNGGEGVILLPRGHLAVSGDICHTGLGKVVLLASAELRPKILINILQCTGQPPFPAKNYQAQMSIVARLRNADLETEINLPWIALDRKNP